MIVDDTGKGHLLVFSTTKCFTGGADVIYWAGWACGGESDSVDDDAKWKATRDRSRVGCGNCQRTHAFTKDLKGIS